MGGFAMALSAPLDSWGWYAESGERQLIFWVNVLLMTCFLAACVLLLSGVNAPYGRYSDTEASKHPILKLLSSLQINGKVAWMVQESPTLISAALFWMSAVPECKSSWGNLLLLACWTVHYTNRTIIYGLRLKGGKPTPLPIMFFALFYCVANGYVQCRSLTSFIIVDLWAPTTLLGVAVWAAGLWANLDADDRLRNLRKPGETGYKIPRGGLFEYVSGANFCAEILEWCGWAIAMGGGLPAVQFAFCTACNIGPRAIAHHKWYLEKFKDDYPKSRKALIPFIY